MTTPPTPDEMKGRIEQLERERDVDRELLAQLADEGVLDRDKIANLEAALITCRRIGAATGILMATRKLTDEQAFDLLSAASQRNNRKLRDIADHVFETGTLD